MAELKAHYQRGGLGDGQTKKVLLECLIELITPFRKRRQELMSDKGELIRVLKEGTEKSQIITGETCEKIKQGLGLSLF